MLEPGACKEQSGRGLSERPPPALGCPLQTEQSSRAMPGLSLRKWENTNAGNLSDFSAVEKQDQYFMSQVKCVSFRILASPFSVLPGASTRCQPLPWSFPVAVEVGSGGSSCPAADPGLCLTDISKERWFGICMNLFYPNLILNYCVVCSFRIPSALLSASIAFPFCWKIAEAWVWGKVCVVICHLKASGFVLHGIHGDSADRSSCFRETSRGSVGVSEGLVCPGGSVPAVPMTQGWLSLWTFCD